MNEEIKKVLEMLKEGKINDDEAAAKLKKKKRRTFLYPKRKRD